MPTWKQNQELKLNLKTKGWHGEIDRWPPRITYYWHKDGLNGEGEVSKHRGEVATHASSNLDHQERYANKGWFWFPPTDDCECTWCKQHWTTHSKQVEQVEPVDKAPVAATPPLKVFMANMEYDATKEGKARHVHRYAGQEIGSLCAFADCTETRQTPFMARKRKIKSPKKRATETRAEAAV